MQEIAPGIWHWTARHPNIGVDVSSYYLPDTGVLLDPMAPDDVLDRLEELGPPRDVLLTNRHHYRDCDRVRERFGARIRAPRTGMHEFSSGEPVEPYDFGEELADGAITAHEVGAICPDEAALHAPGQRALALADGAIRYTDELHFVPDQYMDEPEQTKEDLKAAYRRLLDEVDFDHLLLAHGTPVIGNGPELLRRFVEA